MTAADYLYHRNMLKEYIGIRDNQDLSNELNRAGVTQEQWNELIKTVPVTKPWSTNCLPPNSAVTRLVC